MPDKKGKEINRRSVFFIASAILTLDQLSKFFITARLSIGESITLVPNKLRLTLVYNSGTAFGLFGGHARVFAILSGAVILFLAAYLFLKRSHAPGVSPASLALILGGAAGNLIDRVRLGYVIDFLDIIVWPVFNLADMAITSAVFLLIGSMFLKRDIL